MEERQAQRVLILSTVAFTMLFAVWLMFGVLGVPIKKELHLTRIQFSWLAAVAVLSGSLLRLPFGVLADRVGGRVLMIALLLTAAVPCFLVSRATSYAQLIGYALWLGVAGNSFSVGIAWNSARAPPERQGPRPRRFRPRHLGPPGPELLRPPLLPPLPPAGPPAGA